VSAVRSVFLALLLLIVAVPPREEPSHCAGQTSPAVNRDYERCRVHLNLDACNDAIRRSPSDPVLLVARGDALVRAGRAADALRAYQRAAALAPNTRGIDAKISATQTKLSARRTTRTPAASAGTQKGTSRRYSNAAAETQSH
jgi:predicted Zn-dependent protease